MSAITSPPAAPAKASFQGMSYKSATREVRIALGNVGQGDAQLLGALVALFCDPARAADLAAWKHNEGVLSLEGGTVRVITANDFVRALARRN